MCEASWRTSPADMAAWSCAPPWCSTCWPVAVLFNAAVVCARIWLWKTAPSTAMPVAMPTWRNVLLAPEAMPLRWGCTTEIAPDARTGFTVTDTDPAEDEAGQEHRPGGVRVRRRHEQQPARHEQHADPEQEAGLHPYGQPTGEEGHEEGQQRQRQEAHAGGQRAVAEVVLDVEGEVQEHGEDGGRQA